MIVTSALPPNVTLVSNRTQSTVDGADRIRAPDVTCVIDVVTGVGKALPTNDVHVLRSIAMPWIENGGRAVSPAVTAKARRRSRPSWSRRLPTRRSSCRPNPRSLGDVVGETVARSVELLDAVVPRIQRWDGVPDDG